MNHEEKVFFKGFKTEGMMRIPFSTYSKIDDAFGSFILSLNSTRSFRRNVLDIADDNNKVLNYCESVGALFGVENFIYNYLSVKFAMEYDVNWIMATDSKFISTVIELITTDMKKSIGHFVDLTYEGSVKDENNWRIKNFSDKDVKRILILKYMGNLLIPICTHYCNICNVTDQKKFFYDFYVALCDENCKLSLNRVFELIPSYATEEEKSEIHYKIFTNVIPKLQPINTIPTFICNYVDSNLLFMRSKQ